MHGVFYYYNVLKNFIFEYLNLPETLASPMNQMIKLGFDVGDLVFHLTADKPYSIVYKVIEQSSEQSYVLQSSPNMPGGQYTLRHVLVADMQLVKYLKSKELESQFGISPKYSDNAKYKVGDFVYVLNEGRPYSLCYQLIQGLDMCHGGYGAFNAISSDATPGGQQHVLYYVYPGDLQMVPKKKVKLIRGQFQSQLKHVPEIPDLETDAGVENEVLKMVGIQGYKPCPVFTDYVNEDSPVPPQSVFDAIERDMVAH